VNVGLFGGTFDPPHNGHLIVAQDALVALGLDRVLFVPAARPPHKTGLPLSAAADRARMLELAVSDDEHFDMDLLELERTGPSYTVDTLRELSARDRATAWTLLVGADQYAEFETWREPDEIRRLAGVAVLSRSGATAIGSDVVQARSARPRAGGTGAVGVTVTRIDISATAVRQRVAAGLPIRYLVPTAVETFIFERRLYSRNGTSVAG
jgi:nicotinate-nucleotide adenylyltransferase